MRKKVKTFTETFELPEHIGASEFEAWAHRNQDHILDTQQTHKMYGHTRHFWELAVELYNNLEHTSGRDV